MLQLDNLSDAEAQYDYLCGLKPRMREMVQTQKDNLADICQLQTACLCLDTYIKMNVDKAHYTNNRDRNNFNNNNNHGNNNNNNNYRGNFRGNNQRGNYHNNFHSNNNSRTQGNNSQNNHGRYHLYNRGNGSGNVQNNRPTFRGKCILCDASDHHAQRCPKAREMRETFMQQQANVVYGAATLIDSGTMQHMFNHLDAFECTSRNDSIVICANSQTLHSMHIGTVKLNTETELLQLQNILYVPKLKHNLISVSALTDDGNRISFEPDETITIGNNEKTSQLGKKIGKLYYATNVTNESHLVVTNATLDEYTLWHHRLGHLNKQTLLSMSKYVNGIDHAKLTPMQQKCANCIQAKAIRSPFGTAQNRATTMLERIHSDLCGPLPMPSIDGARYILMFIDDATRYATAYYLQNKSNMFEHFINFKTYAEKQMGNTIKILCSDNGGEYANDEFKEYFLKNGIWHETTMAYTPEQNGIAE